MSIDISRKNEARLRASAQTEGVSIDAFVEQLMNEREEFVAIAERAAAWMPPVSQEETRAKIERGFLQPERGEAVDGDAFSAELLAELDEVEHKRRAG